MNDDKLRELEKECVLYLADQTRKSLDEFAPRILNLITAYRQLEKDSRADILARDVLIKLNGEQYEAIVELLAALKPFAHLKGRSMVTVPNDLRFAEQVYNKHKGE